MTGYRPSDLSDYGTAFVRHLEYLAAELVRISLEMSNCACDLAELGVIPRSMPPAVSPGDGMKVVRLKEMVTVLHRRRKAVERKLDSLDVTILDRNSWEMLFPGGPGEGAWLSWQPGEPEVLFWREQADLRSRRKPLDPEGVTSVLH